MGVQSSNKEYVDTCTVLWFDTMNAAHIRRHSLPRNARKNIIITGSVLPEGMGELMHDLRLASRKSNFRKRFLMTFYRDVAAYGTPI